jgi:hypothetical protein
VATDQVKQQLLAAGAASNNLPVTDYTGLAQGLTYYAWDPATRVYWAGAALNGKVTSLQAAIAGQDAGSYLLFWQRPGGSWHAGADGGGDITSACPLPRALSRLWGWHPHAAGRGKSRRHDFCLPFRG